MMITSLLVTDPEIIIAPIVLLSLAVVIILLVKFGHIINMKNRIGSFYYQMERSRDRSEKKEELEDFLHNCYFGYFHGKNRHKTCPVCGKFYSITEKVTDENGDISEKLVDRSCPICSVHLSSVSYDHHYEIKCNGILNEKYKKNYDLLTKYIKAYHPCEPDPYSGSNGGGGIHGTFIPD